MTVRVSDQEKIEGNVLTKLETIAGNEIVETESIDVTDRGVLCYARTWSKDKSRQFDPPQTLVPEPLKIGVTWELNDIVAGSDMHQKWSVAAEEEVEVPAGKFKAYRLHSEQPWPLSIMIDRWFVRGTGIVKDITTTRGPTGRLLSRVTMTLRKFAVVPVSNTNRSSTLPAPPSLAFSPEPAETPLLNPFGTPSQTPQSVDSNAASASLAPPPRVTLAVSGTSDGAATTEFPSDIPNIFVRWDGKNLPVNSGIRVAWIAEDVGDVAPPNFIVDQTETLVTDANLGARFTLSRPRDGWAPGKYRVELYLEDDLIDTVRVTIHD